MTHLLQARVVELPAKPEPARPQELVPGLIKLAGEMRQGGGQAAAHRGGGHDRRELLLPGTWLAYSDGLAPRWLLDQPEGFETLQGGLYRWQRHAVLGRKVGFGRKLVAWPDGPAVHGQGEVRRNILRVRYDAPERSFRCAHAHNHGREDCLVQQGTAPS